MAITIAIAVPVTTTVLLGAAPYTALHQGFPGLDTGVLTSILLAGADLGSLATVGALIWLLFLRDASRRRAQLVDDAFEITILQAAAVLWSTCAGGSIILEAFDSTGQSLSGSAQPQDFAFLYATATAPRAWTVSFIASLAALVAAFFARRWTGMLIPLWASAFGILAPVVTGQVLVGPEHDFGSDAAIVQTVAAHALLGPLLVAFLRVLSGRLIPPPTLRRIFTIAVVALPALILSEPVIAWFKLSGTSATESLTGWFIIARCALLAVLLVLALIALRLWRRAELQAQHINALLPSALVVIAGWVGVGAAMTRQPPPQYFVPTSISQVFMGFEVHDPPTFDVLFGQWRPNLLFLTISLAAIAVYLLAVRVLRRRGDQWPIGRTISWVLGWAVVVFATSSGFGKYSAPDFGIHMVVHMSLNMLAPGFLVLGGFITLLLRASSSRSNGPSGLHDWVTWVLHWPVLRVLYNPLLVFVLFVGSYYGLYLTGIFGEAMRFHWAHQFMNMHFLIVGYLYYGLIIGVDRPPRPLPHIGKLGFALAAMPFHAFFGIILMTSAETDIIAETFYRYLDLPWADLPAQQYVGGGVAWAGGEIPLLIVVVTLVIQWGKQDAKDARRKDRHFDTGRDDEFVAYNQMLARLAERSNPTPEPDRDSAETGRDTAESSPDATGPRTRHNAPKDASR
ncbi:cytochrome c oxidase assembly protein [Gulosibacter sp. 10]|uniref:cytochrome c oxidase assembly protein n=1 Tax=Gulosibacter sp. 10 TaxID=1255570 RepID=UPI00097E79B7|nr:cytochrome c oxidase assembly protein [Gulosibacter sp. 10]SJM63645.1 Copper resistance protein D [Gulosibacter sp. 10]